MDKLRSLDFTTPSNACLSLRTLAEWVRAGEVKMAALPVTLLLEGDTMTIAATETKGR